ncbi:ABC transporter substrate-binding protein [Mesorhizobium sp. ZC-5]|uniref:ABC transporter substrate-binding protein n=1 Tax=Mesorhizobium sp. ZC-5 TaxID=2986066 RepID=UPI0021E7FDF4|nr:ABC transporter substrate-binding protein [Mesorhizobium sp. ZC-5]MCV3240729.1 ABC transporter substrate-binding protein [Mesorhizobium sp. ZC-5]
MRYKLAGVLAAASLLLSGGLASAQTVMRIGLNDDPDSIDPALSQAFVTRIVLTTFCDKLFDIDAKLGFVPRLAESYEWSEDGKALTFKLRPNVVFHDGEPLNAEAVKYNIQRNQTIEGTFRKPELAPIKSVDVVDELTVRLNLDAPSAPLVSIFADRAGMMVSPKAAEALGVNFGSAPVCAGPFKFVSRVPQGRIIFEKFKDYWDVDNIHIDRVEMLAVNDPTVRLSNLQSGQFDLIERLSPTDVKQVEADANLKLARAPDIGYGYVQFNVGNGARAEKMKDQRVREAIDLSIDREALVNVAFEGLYAGGDQVIAPGSFYHDERPVQKRDVERAKQLLKEAGQENFTFEMMVRPDRDFQVPAQVMQSMLAESGINMVINTTENVTQLEAARQGNFESYMSFWSGRVDPDGNTFAFYTCKSANNRMGYCNPKVEELLTKARQTIDPEARKAIYKEALDLKYHDRPDLSLWYRQLFMAMSSKVENYHLFPDGLIRLQGVKIN